MALKGRSLSTRLRGMRFMRERDEADLRDRLAREQKQRDAAAQWTIEGADGDQNDLSTVVIIDDAPGSDSPSVPLVARQSYGKFNAGLERRMRAAHDAATENVKDEIVLRDDDDDHDDNTAVEIKNEPDDNITNQVRRFDSGTVPHARFSSRQEHGVENVSRRGKRPASGSSFTPRKKFRLQTGKRSFNKR